MDLGNQDINDLLNKYGAIGMAVTPLAGTLVARLVFGKSKMMTNMVRISAGWLACRAFLTPHVDQMHDTLIQLTSMLHNSGY
jgi:hypothetical protein